MLGAVLLVLLAVNAAVVLVVLLVVAARFLVARALEDALDPDEELVDRRELLPEGHRPPEGLSVLSPSERFLAGEAERGLRELQAWLRDPAA